MIKVHMVFYGKPPEEVFSIELPNNKELAFQFYGSLRLECFDSVDFVREFKHGIWTMSDYWDSFHDEYEQWLKDEVQS